MMPRSLSRPANVRGPSCQEVFKRWIESFKRYLDLRFEAQVEVTRLESRTHLCQHHGEKDACPAMVEARQRLNGNPEAASGKTEGLLDILAREGNELAMRLDGVLNACFRREKWITDVTPADLLDVPPSQRTAATEETAAEATPRRGRKTRAKG